MRGARVVMLLGLVMVAASGVRAQKACEACETGQPAENTVAAWLQSGDPRLEAWGAAFALKRGDQALVPEMVGLARDWEPLPVQVWNEGVLSAPRTQEQIDGRAAMSAVMDALVGMHATLELDVLRKVGPDFPSQAIVLVSRMSPGEVQPLLMDWFELPAEGDEREVNAPLRRAAAAMLANHPAPGFVAELMRGTHVWMTIAVLSPGSGMAGGGLGRCPGGNDVEPARAGWPSVTSYWARESKGQEDDAELLISGLDAIRVVRVSQTPGYCVSGLFLDDQKRATLVAQMLAIAPKDLGWGQGTTRITYESDGQVEREIRTAVDAEENAMVETERKLESRGWITSTESRSAIPELELRELDVRVDHPAAVPLPPLPYSNVHWDDGQQRWPLLLSWD